MLRRLEPVTLAQPLEAAVERVLVRDLRRYPAVAAHVARAAHEREEMRHLALLARELDREEDAVLADRHGREHAILGHLEDRMAPRLVLVGLRQRERQFAQPLGEFLQIR